ncbi:hypothetical protein CWE08_06960 [Aliidiomarina iranensis]|uniref:Uncharacterized protein n=1 Tax=Aliidiomarina iranensis TaxID=1434071 RepID=A0A432VWA5_9GAMM|nr:efflux RND transporter periplasmic adaptor subunit [Aliidiomarina iranensis]RUO20835.1 hypothetical protein CWE08_06960 [Aliidiomarina iranensis]
MLSKKFSHRKPLWLVIITVAMALAIAGGVQAQHAHEHQGHSHNASSGSSASAQNEDNPFADENTVYTCSMHPMFRSENPDDRCPICGMALVPVATEDESDESNDSEPSVSLSERSLALLNVQIQPVVLDTAVQRIRVTGQLDFDERALTSISAWTSGRIERLYINYTGASVKAGEPLVEIYSPDLLVAQRELLLARLALAAERPADGRTVGDLGNERTFQAARERLRLLGLDSAQIEAVLERGVATDRVIIKAPSSGLVLARNVSQGDYVNTGEALFQLADSRKMWAVLQVFERDLANFVIGQQLQLEMTSSGVQLNGEIVAVAPRINADSRTRAVHLAIDSPQEAFTAGAFIHAIAQVPVNEVLQIPASAPLITGERAIVFVRDRDDHSRFIAREVTLGRKLGDFYEVRSGLTAGEHVVSRGAFMLDSELQLRGERSMMSSDRTNEPTPAPHNHGGH